MLEDLESEHPPNLFHGVRFILCGFDPISKSQVYNKLVQGGAVDVGQYGPRVTHVVVDNLTYDDPVCVAAREDGKILVNGLWVAHSFDAGMSADHTNIMYRPLRDLKGIPGAKSLVVCLTGYQRQDRDDIMTMVSLMGANFSKPLVANKVTHLICYKFEGDKYELAKRTNRIKLVNHLWLDDCLKAWELLPEAKYNKSGYELEELEAEAKDSEEEADIALKRNQLLDPKQEFKVEQLNSRSLKGLPTVINISHPDLNAPESRRKDSEVLDPRGAEAFGNASCGKPVRSFDRIAGPATVGNDIVSTSRNERFGRSDASILNSKSYNGESPKRTTSLMYSGDVTGELSTAHMVNADMVNAVELNATNSVDIINEHRKGETAIGCFRTPTKAVLPHKEQCSKINVNRTCQAQKTDHSSAAQVSVLSSEMNRSDTFKASSSLGGSNEIRRSPACTTPILENFTTETRNGGDLSKAFQMPPLGSEKDKRESNTESEYVVNRQESVTSEALKTAPQRRSELKKSNVSPNLSLHVDARLKPPTKMSGRKSWSRSGASSQKGSIYLSKSVAEDDPVNSLNVREKTKSNEMIEIVPTAIDLNVDLRNAAHDDLQPESKLQHNPMSMDDETEAPEENEVNERSEVVVHEKNGEGKSDIALEDDKSEYLQRQKGSGHIETYGEENDGAKEKETTCGIRKLGKLATSCNKRFREQKDEAEQKEATCGKRKMVEIKKTAHPSEASEVDEGNEFLKTVEGENRGDVEPGSPETYEEDKLKEAQQNESEHNAIRMHSPKTSDVNKGGTKQKKVTCGKRKLVESSHLENTVNDDKKTLKKRPLSKTNKKAVSSISKTTNSKEATNEDAEKEMTEDNVTDPTGEMYNTKSINKLDKPVEQEKENRPVRTVDQNAGHGKKVRNLASTKAANKIGTEGCTPNLNTVESQKKPKMEPVRFILSGHKLQRKEFQQVIRKLNGKVCKDSHNWSYQATHFIVPEPIRRTEKFFAAAASGRWILKTDYLSDSSRAGKFLEEEPYEWYKSGSSEDDAINLEAPRKWRLQRERTGHGAFYGMNIIIYGECITPSLDTLKRVLKAGEGTILATSPPYTRFLGSGVDFAVVSPGMPRVDIWVQDFFEHEIPCISADYLVDFVCKPGYSLDKHVLYDTYAWAEKALKKVLSLSEDNAEPATPPHDDGESPVPCEEVTTPMNPENDLPCQVCGSRDRGDEMLICGNETKGCGIGTHIDCCDPPLLDVPDEDWFCPKCSKKPSKKKTRATKKK